MGPRAPKVAGPRPAKGIHRRWRALLVAAVLGTLFVLLLHWTRARPFDAAPIAEDRWLVRPASTADAGARTPEDEAVALRADAERACAARHWVECLRDLDAARERDPGGDEAPAVQGERTRAMRGLWGGARP